jgi:hypothetical protein
MLARLHAVSETLDTEMGSRVQTDPITRLKYKDAWQSTGRRADRDLQIRLTVEIGAALDRYTRQRALRHTLKLMRGPAKAAGLGELQRFLESGFDTFREMNGAQDFLDMVITRESALAKALFEARGRAENVGSGNAQDAGSRYIDLLPPDEP